MPTPQGAYPRLRNPSRCAWGRSMGASSAVPSRSPHRIGLCSARVQASFAPREPKHLTIHLPLGGVASTDPHQVCLPLVRPLWLLVAMVVVAVALFVWLRLVFF